MAEDQTNWTTQMGLMGLMSPNKFLNPMYKDQSLPMPGYYGDPTDASGQKIQSYQDTKAQHDAWGQAHPSGGMTLNSAPSSGSGNPQMDQIAGWQALTQPEMAQRGNTYGDPYLNGITAKNGQPGTNPMTNSVLSGLYGGKFGLAPGGASGGAGGATGGGSSGGGANPYDMRQAYLTALSDPQGGKPMPVQGATVPPSAPLGQPSVMSAFLQAHPQGGATTGSYSNKPFFDTLNQLRSA